MKALATLALILAASPAAATRLDPSSGPTKTATTELVRVSSPILLRGRVGGLRPGRPRLVLLTGVAQFKGAGGLSSGRLPVVVAAVVDGTPGCIDGWARPAMDVLLERDGRYVAGARVEGTVPVFGCVRGGEVRLSGGGVMLGDALTARP